ncbi:hypothetical protein JCM16138_15410 [Thermococcus atlanticus]
MGRKKTYTVSGIILILLGIAIASYPVLGYYFSTYAQSPHAVLKPGNNFVYGGYLHDGHRSTLLLIYNVTYVGNGKFRVTFSISNTSNSNVTIFYFQSLENSGKIIGNPKLILDKTLILNESDPLIKTLFPKDSVTVYALNYSRTSKLTIRTTPFSSDFSPNSIGFPYIYGPDLPGPLVKYADKVAYYRATDSYFARTLEVIGPNAPLRYPSIVDGMPTHVPIGVTPEQLDLPELIPEKLISKAGWNYIESSYPTVMLLGLLRTNVQPAYQDWIGALKYSFIQYSAPVDYILILMGIVLLILAGRFV